MPENTIVRGDIDLHPLRSRSNDEQPRRDVNNWSIHGGEKIFTTDPAVEVRRQNVYDYGKRQTMEVRMLSDEGDELEQPKLLLVLEPQWVLKPGEFSRRATVVGQIVGVERHGEELVPSRDNYGPWFEFRRPAPASTDKPSTPIFRSPGLLLLGETISERNQQATVASPSDLPSNAPPEGSQSQAGEQYPLDVPEDHKGRWWIFRRKHRKARADVEAAANIDLGLHCEPGDERTWHASVVLRPIVIFK
jgi:hypothetical protein